MKVVSSTHQHHPQIGEAETHAEPSGSSSASIRGTPSVSGAPQAWETRLPEKFGLAGATWNQLLPSFLRLIL
jgi:hypothetical protein